MKVNSYNLFHEEPKQNGCITCEYHALAENENQVREMAEAAGFDIEGMTIELERHDVRDQLGRSYKPHIHSEFTNKDYYL